jgi:hypothetical protein
MDSGKTKPTPKEDLTDGNSAFREYSDFHDRARAMGYTVDRDYYTRTNNRRQTVFFCCLGPML